MLRLLLLLLLMGGCGRGVAKGQYQPKRQEKRAGGPRRARRGDQPKAVRAVVNVDEKQAGGKRCCHRRTKFGATAQIPSANQHVCSRRCIFGPVSPTRSSWYTSWGFSWTFMQRKIFRT